MPMLVGALAREPIDRLHPLSLVESIAELPPMCAQAISQLTLVGREPRPRLAVIHGELIENLARASVRDAARPLDGVLKVLAEVVIQRRHGSSQLTSTGPSLMA